MADPQNGRKEGPLAAEGVVRLVVRVPKRHAAFLYFQLEANEGVCFHSTLEGPPGADHRDVEVMTHRSMKPQLDQVLERVGLAAPLEVLEEEG